MFDVSAVLLQNTFETTSPFIDAWRLTDFPPHLIAYQVSNNHSFLLFRQTVDGLSLPVFSYTAAVDFIQQPGQTGSAQIPIAVVKSKI